MKSFNWHKIQWMPFYNTQELINIGVVLTDNDNTVLHFKLIDDLSKVKCFFGDSIVTDAALAFDVVKVMIDNENLSDGVDTPQIKIKKQGVAFSNSPAILAEQLMNQVVTAYKVKKKRTRYSPLTSNRVLADLRGKLPEEYKEYVPDNPYLEVNENITAYIPLRKDGLTDVATVLSADYMDNESRSTRFYEAMRDLSVVGMAANKAIENKSAFLIRPQGIEQLAKSIKSSIESEIEMFAYQARDRKFDVVICESSEDFVGKAMEWCM